MFTNTPSRDCCLSSLNRAPGGIGAALPLDAGLSPEVKLGQPVFRTAGLPSQSARFLLCLPSGMKRRVGGAHSSVQVATFQQEGLCEQRLFADLRGDKGGWEEADPPLDAG